MPQCGSEEANSPEFPFGLVAVSSIHPFVPKVPQHYFSTLGLASRHKVFLALGVSRPGLDQSLVLISPLFLVAPASGLTAVSLSRLAVSGKRGRRLGLQRGSFKFN